jgi:hypothetical protein
MSRGCKGLLPEAATSPVQSCRSASPRPGVYGQCAVPYMIAFGPQICFFSPLPDMLDCRALQLSWAQKTTRRFKLCLVPGVVCPDCRFQGVFP